MKNHDLVLGTAGHIDHGKSSLILALTGTDPDRLSEEKQRGITIELGFARLSLDDGTTLGVVDVPGHEKFVRQMISGSTGIDMALLCIAADDGVMPQTTEHLAVLELLRIPTLVVALTKTDLVDGEWVEFMIDEVKGRLAGGPYGRGTRRSESGAQPCSESDEAPKSIRHCSPTDRPRLHDQRCRHGHHGNALERCRFHRRRT